MAQAKKGTGQRKAGQGSKWIRPERRLAIYHRDGFCCAYCGAKVEDGAALTLDHVIACETEKQLPVERRVQVLPFGCNHESNLVSCCLSCNSSKQIRSPRAWYAALRERGIDTKRVSARIRRQLAKPIDLQLGKDLLAIRRENRR